MSYKGNTKVTQMPTKPKQSFDIVLGQEAFTKITEWVRLAPGEISGVGVVDIIKDDEGKTKQIRVDEVFIVDQECTAANTELDAAALANLYYEWIKEGNGYETKPILWWHSHADMNVFWSGTDETCIKDLGVDGFLLSIVFNKKGETRTRIDTFDKIPELEIPRQYTLDNLDLTVEIPNQDNALMHHVLDCLHDKYENVEEDDVQMLLGFAQDLFDHMGIDDIPGYQDREILDFCKKEYDKKVKNISIGGYKHAHYQSSTKTNHLPQSNAYRQMWDKYSDWNDIEDDDEKLKLLDVMFGED